LELEFEDELFAKSSKFYSQFYNVLYGGRYGLFKGTLRKNIYPLFEPVQPRIQV